MKIHMTQKNSPALFAVNLYYLFFFFFFTNQQVFSFGILKKAMPASFPTYQGEINKHLLEYYHTEGVLHCILCVKKFLRNVCPLRYFSITYVSHFFKIDQSKAHIEAV